MIRKLVLLTILLLASSVFCAAQETAPSPTPDNKSVKPASIGIVVDNSGSFRFVLEYVIKTTQLISNGLEADDEGFLVRFISEDKIEILQDLTTNKKLLAQAADDMYVEGGLTAIPEALLFSAKHLLENGKNERKILILISDGENKINKKMPIKAVEFLKENKVQVFVVGVTTVLEDNVKDSLKFLEKLASETGGALVIVDRKSTATETAAAMIKAIRAQY